MRRSWFTLIVPGILLVLDQTLKYWVYLKLPRGANFFIFKPILSLEFYRNPGIAFGIPLPSWFFYTIVSIILIILGYFFRQYYQKKEIIPLFALGLIMGGAFSNLIDRVRLGYVIDYLNFAFWPVFNLGDVMVAAGVIILFIKLVKKPNRRISN